MQKLLIALLGITTLAMSCRSLTSTTYIEPRQSFVLGQGQHGAYTVDLKNQSRHEITIKQIGLDGAVLNSTVVDSRQSLSVAVAKNTTLKIVNASDKKAEVALKLIGDTNLSMGYDGN